MRTLLSLSALVLMSTSLAAAPPTTLYDISWPDPHTRRYLVEVKVEPQSGRVTSFKMPAWRPGRYMLQNFAAGVSAFEAVDEKGVALSWSKSDKDTWDVINPKRGQVTVRYRFYANTADQAGFVLTPELAYLNPFFLMYLADRLDAPATVRFSSKPKEWNIATQLIRTGDHQVYTAPTFHYLIDSPTLMSPTLRTFKFEALGKPIYAHFQGRWGVPDGEEKPWLDGVRRMIEQQAAVFGEFPCPEYHLIYLLLPSNYRSATEHDNSAMFAVPEATTESARTLNGLNGITSHELWHLWNVKRLRPAALWPYRYDREVPTSLHWLTEGITSYYDDLILKRIGLLDEAQYLGSLTTTLSQLDNGAAQRVISASQSSHDSWLGESRYQDPETRISFYDQGTRIGLLLDLEIRRRTKQAKSLDDVMRYLYVNCYKQNKGVEEDGVQRAVEAVAGSDFAEWFRQYVHGVGPFDYDGIFGPLGIQLEVSDRAGSGLRRVGISDVESVGAAGLLIKRVVPQSEAERAGLMSGDLITQLNEVAVAQVNVPTYMDSLAVPTRISVSLIRQGQPLELKLNYRNGSGAKVYRLVLPKASDAPWLPSWLGPRADVPMVKR